MMSAVTVNAAPFTFAQYEQKTVADTFQVTNGAGSTGTIQSINNPVVNFSFLLPALQEAGFATQDAYFSLTGLITTPASIIVQPGPDPFYQLIDSGSISFTRTTAAAAGTARGARTNLLTINFTNALLTGFAGGTSGSLLASTPDSELVFTSDFLDFNAAASLDFGIALSSITGGGLGRTSVTESARAFTADSTGTFSSDPRPYYVNEIPEPAALGLMGLGIMAVGLRRRAKKIA